MILHNLFSILMIIANDTANKILVNKHKIANESFEMTNKFLVLI